jgi:hypothetical protein
VVPSPTPGVPQECHPATPAKVQDDHVQHVQGHNVYQKNRPESVGPAATNPGTDEEDNESINHHDSQGDIFSSHLCHHGQPGCRPEDGAGKPPEDSRPGGAPGIGRVEREHRASAVLHNGAERRGGHEANDDQGHNPEWDYPADLIEPRDLLPGPPAQADDAEIDGSDTQQGNQEREKRALGPSPRDPARDEQYCETQRKYDDSRDPVPCDRRDDEYPDQRAEDLADKALAGS